MNKLMKKITVGLAALCLVAGALVFAQSDLLTNTGYATSPGWSKKYQSETIGVGERDLIAWYSITWSDDRFTQNAVGTNNTPLLIPDNFVVMDTEIDVIEGLLPKTGATNSLHLYSAGDILAATTNLSLTGMKDGVQVDSAATALKTTNDVYLKFVSTGNAVTSGIFKVWLRGYQSW